MLQQDVKILKFKIKCIDENRNVQSVTMNEKGVRPVRARQQAIQISTTEISIYTITSRRHCLPNQSYDISFEARVFITGCMGSNDDIVMNHFDSSSTGSANDLRDGKIQNGYESMHIQWK